ncbi:uncharacterized protein LOC134248599 [Saccostrea cucullata]|uniref:uncharacterized protein LOC134248599 n=1 Tax=Saccostrea cuccullata TaxID=36930 RepID=UPI002ED0E620
MATNDVLNQAYRDILEMEVPPSEIENKVKASSMYKILRPEQEHTLKEAKHSGYRNFDFSLTYTLIRNICKMIPKPTKGKWGVQPAAGEVTVGDDIERIRLIRNSLTAHVSSASISQTEFDDTWTAMSDICQRLETFTGKKYLDKLNDIKKLILKKEDEEDIIKKEIERQHEMMKEIFLHSDIQALSPRSKSMHEMELQEQFKMHTSKEERSSRRYIHFGNTRPATKGEQIKSGAIQIRKKSEEKTKGHQRTSCWTEKTFDKKLEQLKESENYEFRIQRLISFLNIETFNLSSIQRDHMENNDFKDIIERVGYLDCSGLYFSKAEKQSKSFKPFSQSSVWDFLKWITDFNKVFRKTQSPKCRLVLSILFSAYATKEMLEFKPRDLSSIIDRLLECAIENQNHILILEIVRSYLLDFDFHLCKLFKDKNRISSVMDTFLTPALYIILRECPRLQQNAIRLSFCCECSKESRLVIMMLYKGSIEMKDGIPEKVMGVNLVLYNYTQPSDEAHTVFNSSSASLSSTNLPVIAENDARKLFKKHSNLTVISASPYKSSGYSKGKHVIVEKHCFSLLCLHKGFIPFGEREFPKQINGFEVDVQEGYCSLGSGKSIDFGGHIRRARGINTPGHGSIGGFVDLPNGSVGLITCAHVVFSTAELFKPYSEIENDVLSRNTDLNVEFFDKHEHHFQVCGNIVKKCFPTSNNDISVDAALIELDQSVNKIGFPVALADQLYLAATTDRPRIYVSRAVTKEYHKPSESSPI